MKTCVCAVSTCAFVLYSPLDKCSMLLNRFDDDLLLTADSLERPAYRSRTRVRGKARAIHTFRAQNNRQVPIDDEL